MRRPKPPLESVEKQYEDLGIELVRLALDDLLELRLCIEVLIDPGRSKTAAEYYPRMIAKARRTLTGSSFAKLNRRQCLEQLKGKEAQVLYWIYTTGMMPETADANFLVESVMQRAKDWADGKIPYPHTMRSEEKKRGRKKVVH